MKSFCKNIMLAGVAVLASACSFTDLTPTDQIDDSKIFSSVSSLEQAVNGAYGMMSVSQIIRVTAVLSDDVIKGGQNGGAGDDTYQWNYTASTGEHADVWSRQYKVLNEVNRILKGAKSVPVADASEEARKADCIATAKFLRAYNALELLLFFSDIENPDSYGIPYTLQPIVLETPGRDKVERCFSLMLQDLDEARPMLARQTPSNPAYASQTAVDALRARIYLYMHDYAKAYDFASQVLQVVPVASMEDYAPIWSDQSNADIIWKLPRLTGQETIGTIFWQADNGSSFEAAPELLAAFAEGDIRKPLFTDRGVDREGVAVDRVIKYKGTEANVGLADGKMLRASEMKLIMAEAKARMAGGLSEANSLLNDFRRERIENWTDQSYSDTQILEEILLERRRELCFEGHRFFDMRRFGKDLYKPVIRKTLEAGNFRWLQPIPQGEMQGNSVIARQQNPGYAGL